MTVPGQLEHIAIVCSRLDLPGGIERAIVNTANLFQSSGRRVTIIILDESKQLFYSLNKEIALRQAHLHFGISKKGNVLTRKISFLRHIKDLEKIFLDVKPDIIIGTEYSFSIASFLASKTLGITVFAWEHHHFHWLKKSRFWSYLYKKVYPKLATVVCLNKTEQELFEKFGCKAVVIPNFVTRQAKAATESKSILSVGWLTHRKGFDIIPKIAQKIFEKYPEWTWLIIGSGEEEEALRNEIIYSSLDGNLFILPPISADLDDIYSCTAIYVMTSRFECFPMVLLEAMSHGVPVVAFDCQTGPGFIINNNVDGVLVGENDTSSMTVAILDLIAHEEKRMAYGDAAYENVIRFSPDKIYTYWEALFAKYSSGGTRE